MTPSEQTLEYLIGVYGQEQFAITQFYKRVVNYFLDHPTLNAGPLPVIHSLKSRLKDKGHLKEKIKRKWDSGDPINENNFFDRITDLAGVRVLHLHQEQFKAIHAEIVKQMNLGEWYFHEAPVAYTWDPESELFFKQIGIETKLKDSYYTSIHYLVKPRSDSNIKCEIQVRTLYEEIWGEVDHAVNYPDPTPYRITKEQLKVLAKLTSTGTKLVDTVFLSHEELKKLLGQPTTPLA